MAYPRNKNSFVCKSWKSKSVICLFLVSLFPVPNLSWSGQLTVKMSQPGTSVGWLSLYAARANGYFSDEGITLELIIVQGGADIAAIISGSVDFSATSTGGLLRAFAGGTELLGVDNILGKCIHDLAIRKDTAQRLGITPAMPVQERLKRIRGTVIGAGAGIGVIPYQVAYFLVKEAGLEPGKDVTILAAGNGDSALVALRTGHIDIMSYPPPFPQIAIKNGDAISLVANTTQLFWRAALIGLLAAGIFPFSQACCNRARNFPRNTWDRAVTENRKFGRAPIQRR